MLPWMSAPGLRLAETTWAASATRSSEIGWPARPLSASVTRTGVVPTPKNAKAGVGDHRSIDLHSADESDQGVIAVTAADLDYRAGCGAGHTGNRTSASNSSGRRAVWR